jgi:regulator of protease activity HflC (stomatin/prohibitin superfamily)
LLDWLTDILRWVGKFVPRLLIVKTTHCAVAFTRGKHARLLESGLHWVWPLVTEWMMYPVVRQSVNLVTQTLITKDDHTVAVGAIVVYSVDQPLELLAHSYDADDTIRDIAMAAVKSYVVAATLDDLRHRRMDRRLTRRLAMGLAPFGVKVIRAQMTDLAKCRVIKIWNEPYMMQNGGGM